MASLTIALASMLAGAGTRAHAQPLVRATSGRELPVCITTNTPPFALDSASAGLEVDLADALARSLGRSLRVVPIDAGEGPSAEAALAAGRCDVVLGVPVDPSVPAPVGVRVTRPYFRAGFVVVRRVETSLLGALVSTSERIGIDRSADVVYPLRQAGVPVAVAPSSEDVLDRVRSGRLRYGLLWGPWAAWTLRDSARTLALDVPAALPAGAGPWSFGAGVRRATDSEDPGLFGAVDRAVAAIVADGTMQRLLAEYRLVCCVALVPR